MSAVLNHQKYSSQGTDEIAVGRDKPEGCEIVQCTPTSLYIYIHIYVYIYIYIR